MYKLAIIGCGRISNKHVESVVENKEGVRLTACCDIIKERAIQRSEEYIVGMEKVGLQVQRPNLYTDYKIMLEEEDLDLIAICTESGYHAEIAIYCMNKGKHIIVEKPMALSTDDADKMIRTAEIKKVKLCVSHQNRFNPPIQKLRNAIESGDFGRIIAGNARILWNRGENYYRQAEWRGTYRLDGGCLMNQCIHNIDLLQWMLGGEVKWVHGDVSNNIHPYIEAEDYGSIQVKFANGSIGNVEGTVCVYPENLEETLTVIGEKGTVVIGGLAVNKVLTWRFGENSETEESVMDQCNNEVKSVYGSGHTPLYADMIEAIKNNTNPYVDGKSGKKAMEIILAAYQSSKTGMRIEFPLGSISSEQFDKKK